MYKLNALLLGIFYTISDHNRQLGICHSRPHKRTHVLLTADFMMS